MESLRISFHSFELMECFAVSFSGTIRSVCENIPNLVLPLALMHNHCICCGGMFCKRVASCYLLDLPFVHTEICLFGIS